MARVLTERHKRALARGRRRRQERERRNQETALVKYRSWVKLERRAYDTLLSARALHGESSDEALQADYDWRQVWARMPALDSLPSDSAWRAIDGRGGEDR
jgi:hypothetical protein